MLQGVTQKLKPENKRSGEAWTLSQSSKSPAKVAAAHKSLEGKLSKPGPRKSTNAQVGHSETALALSAPLTQDSAQSSELRLSY